MYAAKHHPGRLQNGQKRYLRCRETTDVPVIAPQSDDAGFRAAVNALRSAGRTVVMDVAPGVNLPNAERLVSRNGEWIIEGGNSS